MLKFVVLSLWQVLRDPRWGRCYESYGEDPELVCEMTSLVSGLQGVPPEEHPNGYPFVAGRYHMNQYTVNLFGTLIGLMSFLMDLFIGVIETTSSRVSNTLLEMVVLTRA